MTTHSAIPPVLRRHPANVAREGRRMGGSYPAAVLLPIGGGEIDGGATRPSTHVYSAESRRQTRWPA